MKKKLLFIFLPMIFITIILGIKINASPEQVVESKEGQYLKEISQKEKKEEKKLIKFSKDEGISDTKNWKSVYKCLSANNDKMSEETRKMAKMYMLNHRPYFEKIKTNQKFTDYNYDPEKAIEYARKWSHNLSESEPNGTNYNDEYMNFIANGGDCMNYVSQCLLNGGLMQSKEGETEIINSESTDIRNELYVLNYDYNRSNWYYDMDAKFQVNNKKYTLDKFSISWVNTNYFYSFWENSFGNKADELVDTYAISEILGSDEEEYKENFKKNILEKSDAGDIFFLSSDGVTSYHVMIFSKVDKSTDDIENSVLYCGHDNDRLDVSVYNTLKVLKSDTIKIMHFSKLSENN
jgi:hypothetical protein